MRVVSRLLTLALLFAVQVILTPTPRWPDLLVVHDPLNRVLFSSKLFSAHAAPPAGDALDEGGWEAYGDDWRFYFECMLAPSARQVRHAVGSSASGGAAGRKARARRLQACSCASDCRRLCRPSLRTHALRHALSRRGFSIAQLTTPPRHPTPHNNRQSTLHHLTTHPATRHCRRPPPRWTSWTWCRPAASPAPHPASTRPARRCAGVCIHGGDDDASSYRGASAKTQHCWWDTRSGRKLRANESLKPHGHS